MTDLTNVNSRAPLDHTVGTALDLLGPAETPDTNRAYTRQRLLQQSPVASITPGSRLEAIPTMSRVTPPHAAIPEQRSSPMTFLRRQPFRAAAAVAVVLFGMSFLTSPMQSLANQFLTIFRVQDFTPVTISTMQGIPDLTRFGDMSTPQGIGRQARTVDSVAAASAAVGFSVKAPSVLPNGLPTTPSAIAVSAAETMTFTFRADKARDYLASIGRSDFGLPAKFDGAMLQVNIPAAAMLTFGPTTPVRPADGTRPGRQMADGLTDSVIVVQAKSPTVESSGVSLQELRDFMLSLPGLPPETAAQLRAIGDPGTTLPIPVPAGESARKIQVNGAPGLIYAEANSRISGGIIWQRDGIVYAAGGALNEADLLSIAGSVR